MCTKPFFSVTKLRLIFGAILRRLKIRAPSPPRRAIEENARAAPNFFWVLGVPKSSTYEGILLNFGHFWRRAIFRFWPPKFYEFSQIPKNPKKSAKIGSYRGKISTKIIAIKIPPVHQPPFARTEPFPPARTQVKMTFEKYLTPLNSAHFVKFRRQSSFTQGKTLSSLTSKCSEGVVSPRFTFGH